VYGNGDTILFWHDLWNVKVMKLVFPDLHSFAKNDMITLRNVLQFESLHDHFHLPLFEIAFEQFCEMNIFIQSLHDADRRDQWSYIWGNGTYSMCEAYNHLIGQEYVHPTFRWIWKSCCQMKQKVFF
jgi:hypothetical protein